jgi:hypothetical protein
MDTALDPNETSPRHVLLDRADEKLAQAYEQLTRAGEEMARAEEQLSKLEQHAARERSSFGSRTARGFTGLALAACVFATAAIAQSSHGDTVRQILARWAPQLVSTASLPLDGSGLPAQLSPRIAEANAAQTAVPQSSPQDAAPAPAPITPELTQLLQSMARDIAALGQGIEELKARQEQMARDNASAVEQLKASQDQMARAIAEAKTFDAGASNARTSNARASNTRNSNARASAQNVRPGTSAPPQRQTATSTHKPVQAHPSPPAAARP